MTVRRVLPVLRRRQQCRAALAVGAVSALVLAPAAGALADDDAPPPDEPGDDAPLAPAITLPTAEPEDQAPAASPTPDATPTPTPDATPSPAPGPAPSPVPSPDAAGDGPLLAVEAPPVEAYFGTRKVSVRPSVTGYDALADNEVPMAVLPADAGHVYETDLTMTLPGWRETYFEGAGDLTLAFADADEDYWYLGGPVTLPPCSIPGTGTASTPPAFDCSHTVTMPFERKQRWVQVALVADGPVADADAELYRLDPATGAAAFVAGTGTTAADGVLDFGLLPTGDYEVVVGAAPGFAQLERATFTVEALAARSDSTDPSNATTHTVRLGRHVERAVTPRIVADPAVPDGTDLSATLAVRRSVDGGDETVETVAVGADGRPVSPIVQAAGETLVLEVVDPPAGYMIADPVTVPGCVDVDGTSCTPVEVPVAVVPAYRRVSVTVTAEGSGAPLARAAVVLLEHDATRVMQAGRNTGSDGTATFRDQVPVGSYVLATVAALDGERAPVDTTQPLYIGERIVEIAPVRSVAEAEANVLHFELAAAVFGPRPIMPVVRSSDPDAPAPDLTSTVTVTSGWFGGVTNNAQREIPSTGLGDAVGQVMWPVTLELVTPPAGFMLTAETTATVEPCRMDDPETVCDPVEVVFEVAPAYRRATLRAVTEAGQPLSGVTMELYAPPGPAPDPAPDPQASTVLAAAAPSPAGLSRIAVGTSSLAGTVPVPGTVRPTSGYVVVVTGVPDGYVVPESVPLDIPAVLRAADADTPLTVDVRIARAPVAAPPAQPRAGALPATGADPVRPLGLALALIVLGAAGIAVRRRSLGRVDA